MRNAESQVKMGTYPDLTSRRTDAALGTDTRGRDGRNTDAAQFMPFAALVGYEQAVAERCRPRETRRTPTEERVMAVSRMLMRLRRGDRVLVRHYDGRREAYVTTCGTVRQVDEAYRRLRLKEGGDVLFEDIWELALATEAEA